MSRDLNTSPRQMIATIVYRTEILGSTRPRQFTVYLKKEEFKYYKDLKGVKMYEQQVPLSDLYHNFQENMDKMFVFKTKKPDFDPVTR